MFWLVNLLSFVTVTLLVMLLFGIVFKSKNQVGERLESIKKMEGSEDEEDVLKKPFSERVIQPFIQKLGNKISGLAPKEIKSSIEKKIVYAGNPKNINFSTFVMAQLILAIGLPLVLVLFVRLGLNIDNVPLLALLLGLLGFFIPNLILNSKVLQRQKTIQKALPDMLDLLLVSVEAGLGFDMALKRVTEKHKGELSKEMQRALEEIRVGKSRSEALRGMVDRTGVADLRTFVSAVIQAEQLGSDIARTLRIQAETMRQKRRQRAEEMAMKAPIKMLFPLIFFILPALFVVILGPPLIRIFDFFVGGGF